MGKSIDGLQSEWKLLFQRTLPEAATSKAPSQIKWPMPVDHCFSRIILDLTVGVDTPWTNKIKSPAYKNMTKDQLEKRILMGNEILEGKVDLIELNEKSLVLRREAGRPKKRKSDHENSPANSSSKRKKSTRASKGETESEEGGSSAKDGHGEESPYFRQKLDRIKTEGDRGSYTIPQNDRTFAQDSLSEKVLTALCQVPQGKYATYGAISNHLSSSARAVGNALKNNPFAPQEPCHRVLASGGGLGGFGGSWGRKVEAGKNDEKKINLLRDEGVRFDGSGKVMGVVWHDFT